MVEHQGAVGLRGGVYTTTQHRKETCSDTSVQAEVSYSHPTSLRYYTPAWKHSIRYFAASDATQTYDDKI
eukprot:6427478-Pyramimonas_sp.AAC.1